MRFGFISTAPNANGNRFKVIIDRRISLPGQDMVIRKSRRPFQLPLTVKHHSRDYTGSNHDSVDAAEWTSASYWPDPLANLDPLDNAASPYREAAIGRLRLLWVIDEFLTAADDPRLGWVAVAVALRLTSARGLTVANIAGQLGCSPTTINRYISRFAKMADLDLGGDLQSVRPNSRSNGAECREVIAY
jgi:hypothetical protein